MGMYDNIDVYMTCPLCKTKHVITAQTKDLQKQLFSYKSLPDSWFEDDRGKTMREQLQVFPKTPLDRSWSVWDNQAERSESLAYTDNDLLQFVYVIGYCMFQEHNDKETKYFDGKIRLHEGHLIGDIYDIESSEV